MTKRSLTWVAAGLLAAGPALAAEPDLPAPTRQEVAAIQQELRREGYAVHRHDGRLDTTTLNALIHFKIDHGMAPDAVLDRPTLMELGVGGDLQKAEEPMGG